MSREWAFSPLRVAGSALFSGGLTNVTVSATAIGVVGITATKLTVTHVDLSAVAVGTVKTIRAVSLIRRATAVGLVGITSKTAATTNVSLSATTVGAVNILKQTSFIRKATAVGVPGITKQLPLTFSAQAIGVSASMLAAEYAPVVTPPPPAPIIGDPQPRLDWIALVRFYLAIIQSQSHVIDDLRAEAASLSSALITLRQVRQDLFSYSRPMSRARQKELAIAVGRLIDGNEVSVGLLDVFANSLSNDIVNSVSAIDVLLDDIPDAAIIGPSPVLTFITANVTAIGVPLVTPSFVPASATTYFVTAAATTQGNVALTASFLGAPQTRTTFVTQSARAVGVPLANSLLIPKPATNYPRTITVVARGAPGLVIKQSARTFLTVSAQAVGSTAVTAHSIPKPPTTYNRTVSAVAIGNVKILRKSGVKNFDDSAAVAIGVPSVSTLLIPRPPTAYLRSVAAVSIGVPFIIPKKAGTTRLTISATSVGTPLVNTLFIPKPPTNYLRSIAATSVGSPGIVFAKVAGIKNYNRVVAAQAVGVASVTAVKIAPTRFSLSLAVTARGVASVTTAASGGSQKIYMYAKPGFSSPSTGFDEWAVKYGMVRARELYRDSTTYGGWDLNNDGVLDSGVAAGTNSAFNTTVSNINASSNTHFSLDWERGSIENDLMGVNGTTAFNSSLADAVALTQAFKNRCPTKKFGWYLLPWQGSESSLSSPMASKMTNCVTTLATLWRLVDFLSPDIYQRFKIIESGSPGTGQITATTDLDRMTNFAVLCLQIKQTYPNVKEIVPHISQYYLSNSGNPLNNTLVPNDEMYRHIKRWAQATRNSERSQGVYLWGGGGSVYADATEAQFKAIYQAINLLPYDPNMPRPA